MVLNIVQDLNFNYLSFLFCAKLNWVFEKGNQNERNNLEILILRFEYCLCLCYCLYFKKKSYFLYVVPSFKKMYVIEKK